MHQPQALVDKGGWLLWGRRGARKEPRSTSGHPVAVQNATKRRGERPVLGKEEAAQLAAAGGETLLQKRHSDLEPWRKQTGKPLSIDHAVFYNWFTLKRWWPEEAQARLMACLQQSMFPLPSHYRYQGQDKRCVAQQSYLLCTGFSPTGLHSHLCKGGGGGNCRGNSEGNETNWCCHQPLGDSRGCNQPWDGRFPEERWKTAEYGCWRLPPCRCWEETAKLAHFYHPQPCSSEA